MSGGEALDLALGLLRAPARRALLAARPLPDGMTVLLDVAGGSGSAVRAAAGATGAEPAELVEAARFFVQQVLFTDGASAYRLLGAEPDAPQARLHTHHRLLQRWLHPDRDGGEAWDSAFSARVNEAWSRLRTPHARRAYDRELARRGGAPAPAEPPAARGWRHPNGLVPVGEGPAVEPARGPRRYAGPVAVAAAVLLCAYLAWLVQQRDARAQAGQLPPARTGVARPAPPPQATPAAAPLAAVDLAPLASLPATTVAEADWIDNDRAAGSSPAPAGRGHAPDAPGPTTAPDVTDPAFHPAETTNPPATAHVGHVGPTYETVPAVRAGPAHADTEAPATPAVPIQTPVHAGPAHGDTEDPLELLQQAERTVAQAAAFLASEGARAPAIWHDFPTEAAATDARARLHARLEGTRSGGIDLASPHWRLDTGRAVFDAGYRIGTGNSGEEGRIRIEMTRRDRQWLVTSLQLEPAT